VPDHHRQDRRSRDQVLITDYRRSVLRLDLAAKKVIGDDGPFFELTSMAD